MAGASKAAVTLAWLPVVQALETAASAARRHYVRSPKVARSPTGTLRVGAWMQELARGRPDRVPVDRFQFTIDNDVNRLFRGVASLICMRTARERGDIAAWVRGRAERVKALLAEAAHVSPSLDLVERVEAKTLDDLQQRAVSCCRDALSNRWANLEVGRVDAELAGFELSISTLFEDAVRGALRNGLGGSAFVDQPRGVGENRRRAGVERQTKRSLVDSALKWDDTGNCPELQMWRAAPALIPDLHVRVGDRFLVGDVKYKRLRHGNTDNRTHRPLQREDLHQIAAYMLAWPAAVGGLMVFPWAPPVTVTGSQATLHVTTLWVAPDRPVGVFVFAPERWKVETMRTEPLIRWIGERLARST